MLPSTEIVSLEDLKIISCIHSKKSSRSPLPYSVPAICCVTDKEEFVGYGQKFYIGR